MANNCRQMTPPFEDPVLGSPSTALARQDSPEKSGDQLSQGESLSRQSTSIDKDLTNVISEVLMRQSIEAAVAECKFVVTIADPRLPDCPLIAVSEQFVYLTGFQRLEILGVNCRFLNQGCDLDPNDLMGLRMSSQTGAPFTAVVPNRKKSGELFLNLLDVRGLTVAKDRYTREDIWFLIGIQADVTDLAEDEVPADHMIELQRMADGIRNGITKEIKDMALSGVQENVVGDPQDQSRWVILDPPIWRTEASIDSESAAALGGMNIQSLPSKVPEEEQREEPRAVPREEPRDAKSCSRGESPGRIIGVVLAAGAVLLAVAAWRRATARRRT